MRSIARYLWRPLSYYDQRIYLEQWERRMRMLPLAYREFVKRCPENDPSVPKYAIVARILSPVYSRVPCSRDAAMAEIGLAQTAMALQAYKGRFGSYPASLDELKAKIGWRLPDDPFSGRPFVYKRQGEGFRVYSWSWNMKDDGGRTMDEIRDRSDPNKSDIVWMCEK